MNKPIGRQGNCFANENMPCWYHGSPNELTVLRPGSTITQNRRLAEVFSHKPPLVTIDDDGTIRHTGVASGLLYQVSEQVNPEDIGSHPRTSMPPGFEWLTTRELSVILLGPVEILNGEILSEADLAALHKRFNPETPARPG